MVVTRITEIESVWSDTSDPLITRSVGIEWRIVIDTSINKSTTLRCNSSEISVIGYLLTTEPNNFNLTYFLCCLSWSLLAIQSLFYLFQILEILEREGLPVPQGAGGAKRRMSEKHSRNTRMKLDSNEEANKSLTLNQCELCEKFFSTKTNLKRHISNVHQIVKKEDWLRRFKSISIYNKSIKKI